MRSVASSARNETAVVQLLLVLLLACGSSWASTRRTKKGDRIVIVKPVRTLTLMSGGQVLKTYKVALGGEPIGAKE